MHLPVIALITFPAHVNRILHSKLSLLLISEKVTVLVVTWAITQLFSPDYYRFERYSEPLVADYYIKNTLSKRKVMK